MKRFITPRLSKKKCNFLLKLISTLVLAFTLSIAPFFINQHKLYLFSINADFVKTQTTQVANSSTPKNLINPYFTIDGTTLTGLTDLGAQQKELEIPDGVTKILDENWQHYGCATKITIPSSVTYIAPTFLHWTNTLIRYPDFWNGQVINKSRVLFRWWVWNYLFCVPKGKTTFANTTLNLNEWKNSDNLPFTIIADYALDVSLIESYYLMQKIILPDQTKSIGNYAFNNCWYLTTITIPESVRSIGQNIFQGCAGLEQINSGKVIVKNKYVFNKSPVLFDWWVQNHPYGALNGETMAQMETVDLTTDGKLTNDTGRPFTIIAPKAFESLRKVKNIILNSQTTKIAENAFSNSGIAKTNWKDLNNLQYIGEEAFANTSLTSVTIPSTVTYVGNNAFWNCRLLTSDNVINKSPVLFDWWVNNYFYVTLYGKKTMAEMKTVDLNKLTNSTGQPFTIIGEYAFFQNYLLKNINLNSQTTKISDFTFENASTEIVNWSDLTNLQYIGEEAFANTSLTSVTIPSTVTYVGNNAFWNCRLLTSDNVINKSPVLFDWWFNNHLYDTLDGQKTMAEMKNFNSSDLQKYTNSAGQPFTIIDYDWRQPVNAQHNSGLIIGLVIGSLLTVFAVVSISILAKKKR